MMKDGAAKRAMVNRGVEEGFTYIFSIISATIAAKTNAVTLRVYCTTNPSSDSVALLERTGTRFNVSRLALGGHARKKSMKFIQMKLRAR